MKNIEKYRDQIIEIVSENSTIGVKNGKPVSCNSISCSECDLSNDYENCNQATVEWYLEEYKDKTAHWEYDSYNRIVKCSVCGRCAVLPTDDYMTNEEIVRILPYCHCGAKMS